MTAAEIEEAVQALLDGFVIGVLCAEPKTSALIAYRIAGLVRKRMPPELEITHQTDQGFLLSNGGQLYSVVNMVSYTIDELYLDGVMTGHLKAIKHAMSRKRQERGL